MKAGIKKLTARLLKLDAALVSDVLDEAGLPHQVVSDSLKPLSSGMKLAGPAVCARGEPKVHVADPKPPVSGFGLDRAMIPGGIAVIETGDFTGGACIGGFVATSLQKKGCAGIIVNGAIRDALEIRGMKVPTFTKTVTPINGTRRWEFVEFGQPIFFPGQTGPVVKIKPGDLLLGDDDGIVVIPYEIAEEIIAASEELGKIEKRIMDALNSGEDRAAVFKQNPRFDHIKRLV